MSKLKPFQKATVNIAMRALSRKSGYHRFLIADEVGLGKTLVAGEIIRRMSMKGDQPFVVLYVCSNLSIGAQNKRKLLEWLPENRRRIAVSSIDRLTLLPEQKNLDDAQVHLYTLTPDTSIPMRGGSYGNGKKEERALIHALVKKLWPEFFVGRSRVYFRGSVRSDNWKELVKKKRAFVSQRKSSNLREMFRESVRKELKLTEGMHVLAALNQLENEEGGRSKIIARFRNALAAGAIEQLRPDLVIFDEFQRFRDLLEEDMDESAARVIQSLRGDGTGSSIKLLLLSATPYRPYTKYWEDDQKRSHRAEFFELLEFLYKRDKKARYISKQCAAAFSVMESELLKGEYESQKYKDARNIIEKYLKGIICRTEREDYRENLSENLLHHQASVNKADLKVFKHLVRSFRDSHKTTALSYWNSIPLPMQTMGPHYQTWSAAQELEDRSVQSLRKAQRDNFTKLTDLAHPRLRALQSIMPAEKLKLPWIRPSAPWWPLKGLWKSCGIRDGKIIIFSRFRAVPQAISSLMSYNIEVDLLSSSQNINYEDLAKRRSLQPKTSNVALLGHFYPSIFLVKNTDPIANGIGSMKIAKDAVEKQLRRALRVMGIRVRSGKQRRPTWSLIAALERREVGSVEAIDGILNDWSNLHKGASQEGTSSDTNFIRMLKKWRQASGDSLSEITTAELENLTKYALSAPGVVVGRALYRHWAEALEGNNFKKCIEVSWKGLRNYLSSRLFVKALSGSEARYPSAIRRAALEGNLESVLDEHLWIASKLGVAAGEILADDLLEAMKVRTSNFFVHPLGNKSKENRFSLRCHAVMPFTDPRADKSYVNSGEDGEKPIRTDELRKAFNTPFWPHILATTSIGQEGLDFHVWCETLLHWDLCSNPVDMEQREGRIRRFGGLSIRRKLSELLWCKDIQVESWTSPWAKLERMAEKKYANDTGLSPWWVCEGADVRCLTIDLPASMQKKRLEMLRRERLLYRLALGQPNQEDLVGILSDKYTDIDNMKNIGLNLSAWSALKK